MVFIQKNCKKETNSPLEFQFQFNLIYLFPPARKISKFQKRINFDDISFYLIPLKN